MGAANIEKTETYGVGGNDRGYPTTIDLQAEAELNLGTSFLGGSSRWSLALVSKQLSDMQQMIIVT